MTDIAPSYDMLVEYAAVLKRSHDASDAMLRWLAWAGSSEIEDWQVEARVAFPRDFK